MSLPRTRKGRRRPINRRSGITVGHPMTSATPSASSLLAAPIAAIALGCAPSAAPGVLLTAAPSADASPTDASSTDVSSADASSTGALSTQLQPKQSPDHYVAQTQKYFDTLDTS